MTGIVGQGTTYDLPNFVGEVFLATPTETPFLSALGGLTGGKQAQARLFAWQGYDLRAPGQNVALEGATAPDPQERVRFPVTNVVEIHQESVEVSYTRMGATGDVSPQGLLGANPVQNEMAFQINATLKEVARDVEYSFLRGTGGTLPTDNTQPRKTRGLLAAIVTNVIAAGGAAITKTMVDQLLQNVFDSGGISDAATATLIVPSFQKRSLTAAYATSGNYREMSRTVGGLNLTTIDTDFGTLNIMLNRYMPSDTIAVASLDQCAPVFLEVPGKGFLFVEPLAKTGASEKAQIYGEIGLEYGNEKAHGKITGLATS